MANSRLKKNIEKPSCFEVERGNLTKATNMLQVKQDVVSEWSILNHLKKDPFFPTKTWQTEPWSQGFHPLDTESLPPKFGYGILGIHRLFRICRLVCLLRLAVSKHGHPFQPLEILKITRTGLGVSTPTPKFSSLILMDYWWQTPGWRKNPKTLLFRSCEGCPHKRYKHATGQTRCSQRVIHFEPPWKKNVLPYQNMANRTFVPRFSSPRHRILSPKFGFGLLGGLICLLRLAVSKHWNSKVSTWTSVSTP